MAEDQKNYLAEVNAARQRARGSVRSRIDQIIDPMQSAADMDRLQGTSVMPTTGQVDPGVEDVFGLASGGGGAAPVRTAVGGGKAPVRTAAGPIQRVFGGRSAPTQSAPMQSSGQCQIINGRRVCPGSSSTVSQAPMSSTVVSSAPMTTTVAQQPMSSGPSGPPDTSTYGQIWDQATSLRPVDGQVGVSVQLERKALTYGDYDQQAQERGLEYAKIDLSRRIADQKYELGKSESRLADEQAVMTKQHTAPGYAEIKTDLLLQVQDKKITPETAVEAIVKMHTTPLQPDNKREKAGKETAPFTNDQLNQVTASARREVFGTLFIRNAIDESPVLRQHANVMAGVDLNAESPGDATGKPKDVVLGDALTKLAQTYERTGVFDKPWEEVSMLLTNDAGTVLRSQIPKMFTAERQDEFALMKDPQARIEAQKKAVDDGIAYAKGLEEYVTLSVRSMWERRQAGDGSFNPSFPFPPKQKAIPSGAWPLFVPEEDKPVDSNNTMAPVPEDGKST
jgi:hypothetical protein